MKRYTLIIVTLILLGCNSKPYPDSDYEFTSEESALVSAYKENDTIYFESNLGDVDTFRVVAVDSASHTECGKRLGGSCSCHMSATIEPLPIDKWKTEFEYPDGHKLKCHYGYTVNKWIDPHASRWKSGLDISYNNFNGTVELDSSFLTSMNTDTINKVKIDSIYTIPIEIIYTNEPDSFDSIANSSHIKTVYWTAKYGLTAYESLGGETWLIRDAIELE